MSTHSYSFGDSPTAADRLAVLARVFEPEMRAFLAPWARLKPELAIDLGCGSGHTTRLLARNLHATRTVGMDISEAFLAIARKSAIAGITFLRHDVTRAPFPAGPAAVMFAHLLLYHLPDPAATLATWGSQLRTGGVILVDDIEAMESDHPVLRRYLEIVGELVRHSGGNPSIGPALARLGSVPGLELTANEAIDFDVATGDAATMFRMNLHTWRTNPYITEHYEVAEIDAIARDFDALRGLERQGDIRWRFRQMALGSVQ